MTKVKIELIGNEDDVLSFIGLCAKIELLGIWGASRIIPVDIDGDGSARLRFNIRADVVGRGEVDLIDEWMNGHARNFEKQVNSKIETHCIGE